MALMVFTQIQTNFVLIKRSALYQQGTGLDRTFELPEDDAPQNF